MTKRRVYPKHLIFWRSFLILCILATGGLLAWLIVLEGRSVSTERTALIGAILFGTLVWISRPRRAPKAKEAK